MTRRTDTSPLAPPDVAVSNITKRFGALVALDDVSIHFKPGSFHARAFRGWRVFGRL